MVPFNVAGPWPVTETLAVHDPLVAATCAANALPPVSNSAAIFPPAFRVAPLTIQEPAPAGNTGDGVGDGVGDAAGVSDVAADGEAKGVCAPGPVRLSEPELATATAPVRPRSPSATIAAASAG